MKSFCRVWFHRTLYLPFVAAAALFALQCIELPLEPVLPNWNTQLSIPLVDSTYMLNDEFIKNLDIQNTGLGYIYRPQRFHYDPVSIGSELRLYPPFGFPQVVQQSIGMVALSVPAPIEATVAPGALVGDPLPLPSLPMPAIGLRSFPANGIPLIQEFEYAYFSSGRMDLSIRNDLPIPIEFPGGFSIKNRNSGVVVAHFPAAILNPGTTWTPASAMLNNVTMENDLVFDAQFQSAGSGGNPVTFNPDAGVQVSFAIRDLLANSVRAKLVTPFEQQASSSSYVIDSLTLVENVSFNNGKMRVTLQSSLDAAATVNITINEMRDRLNQPFSFDMRLEGNASYSRDLDMREWAIRSEDGGLTNRVVFVLKIKSDPITSSSAVTINATDYIRASLEAVETPFAIRRLSGVSRTLSLNVDESVDIPLGTFTDKFTADSVFADSITIRLHVTVPGHPIDVTLSLLGLDEQGNTIAALAVPTQRVQPDQDAVIDFGKREMAVFLSQYISRKGHRIAISGMSVVNPQDVYNSNPHQVAVLKDTSEMYMSLEIDVPISAAIFNGQIRDVVEISGESEEGEEIDRDMLTAVKQARVYFDVTNAIPVGVNLQMDFLDINNNVILSLPKPGQHISITAGTPASPSRNPQPILLDITTDDAQRFADAARVAVSIGLNTAGRIAQFSPNDYLKLRSYSKMVFNINPDNVKD